MRLVHFSATPLAAKLRTIKQRPTTEFALSPYLKPYGLWVSDEDTDWGWMTWCKSEEFQLEALRYAHEITLADDANVRIIRTLPELDAFHAEFGIPRDGLGGIVLLDLLDWPTITQRYDGVIITPYQWERQLEYSWYYGWDCASGCLWHPRAVAAVSMTRL